MTVAEAYPNCPEVRPSAEPARGRRRRGDHATGRWSRGTALDRDERALVRRADTFFVASSNPAGHVDASHRGGEPGFVELVDERTLSVPDYPGNHMAQHPRKPRAEPARGRDVPRLRERTRADGDRHGGDRVRTPRSRGGTGRSWRFRVEEWFSFALPARLESELLSSAHRAHQHLGREQSRLERLRPRVTGSTVLKTL